MTAKEMAEPFRVSERTARRHIARGTTHCDDMMAEARLLALTAVWVIEVEWPGIMRISRALREERQMTGEVFEGTWRAVRSGEAVRRRRERRASERCGFVAPGSGP
jgi:hypothetical protein